MAVSLQLPPILLMGGGCSKEASAVAQRLGMRRPLLVLDPFLADHPLTRIAVGVFAGVTPDPDLDVVAAGLAAVRAHEADGLIALGGGSAIDAAKAIAIMATNGGSLVDYMGYHKVPKPGLPLIAIPTTAGTGSEATRVTVITDRARNVKMMILDGYLQPSAAIVDYELSLTMPKALTAAVGIDSLTHALEAYVSRKANTLSDAIALESGRLIAPHLERAYRNANDLPAKEAMMQGATLGGMAFSNASVALVHGMSRPLGAYFHVPHGLSNAMLLPAVTRFSLPGDPGRYIAFAQHTGLGPDLVASLERFNRELAVPSPQEYGIDAIAYHAAIPRMAEDALASGSPGFNPRVPSKDEVMALYREVYAA